jgi:hypothetical protein
MHNDTDTSRLARYLSRWEGHTVCDAGLQRYHYPSYDPESVEFPHNRTWGHVRTEHPEFINTHLYNTETSVIDRTLLDRIASLNKNYPKGVPGMYRDNPFAR